VAASAAMGQLRAVLAELLAAEADLGQVSEQLAAHGQELTLITEPDSGAHAVLDLVRLAHVTGEEP
jgi:hypothetical protein